MSKNDRVLMNLGLALRSGNLVSGEFMTEKTIRGDKAKLVIIAGDSSANTKKKFRNMCDFHKVPYMEYGTKNDLGNALGKEYRASLAVTSEGFANMIQGNQNKLES